MRILRALFFSIIGLLVTLVVTVYVAREVLLFGSLWLISHRYDQLEKMVGEGDYTQECLRLGVFGGEAAPQLRFFSQTEYATEVICGTMTESAVVVEKYQLWPLVKKGFSDSGFIDSKDQGLVTLSVLGRMGAVEKDEFGSMRTIWNRTQTVASASGPLANCGGYGMQCCVEGEEQGMGDQIRGALDCPKSCFSACYSRPVVLSFNSNPFYDFESRILTVKRNQPIDFSFVISETQRDVFADARLKEKADPIAVLLSLTKQLLQKEKNQAEQEMLQQIVLDYGDGTQETLQKLQDTAIHSYTCARELCRYTAVISAKNHYGAQSLTGYLSTITINVIP